MTQPESPFNGAFEQPKTFAAQHPKTVAHIAQALQEGRVLSSGEVADLFLPETAPRPRPRQVYSVLLPPYVRQEFAEQYGVKLCINHEGSKEYYYDENATEE